MKDDFRKRHNLSAKRQPFLDPAQRCGNVRGTWLDHFDCNFKRKLATSIARNEDAPFWAHRILAGAI